MADSLILILHIIAGSVAILSGMTVIFLRKGSSSHHKIGDVFFYTMVLMSSSATYLAYLEPSWTSLITGLLTFYLVVTAKLAIRNKIGQTSFLEMAGFVYIVLVFCLGLWFSFETLTLREVSGKAFNGLDYFLFFHTGVSALCIVLDLIMIINGGAYGRHRLARHLGRMIYALWIATGSFFLGQQQFFPAELQGGLLLASPVILVICAMVFWLIKVMIWSRLKSEKSRSKKLSLGIMQD